jgi:hypothetical protein
VVWSDNRISPYLRAVGVERGVEGGIAGLAVELGVRPAPEQRLDCRRVPAVRREVQRGVAPKGRRESVVGAVAEQQLDLGFGRIVASEKRC